MLPEHQHVREQQRPPRPRWLAITIGMILIGLIASAVLWQRCVSISDFHYWTPWSGCESGED